MSSSDRADLYAALAEVLAEPPQWMSLPGREWPLFELASRLTPNSTGLLGLALVKEETLSLRQARYAALFGGAGRQPRYWLSESAFLMGRILSEATFAVAKVYAQHGVQVNGSELPDSAWLELAFLAHLASFSNGLADEKHFIKEHAGRWLPALGQTLVHSGDSVYAAIGQLLVDALTPSRVVKPSTRALSQPVLSDISACILCGFCAQRCPSGAMFVHETESTTSLMLNVDKCNGCERCISACTDGLLALEPASKTNRQTTNVLLSSERVPCTLCGAPTVSRAEINYMTQKIGHPAWLEMCLSCRVSTPPEHF